MASVLGIAGSPRRHGNSETLLDATLQGAARRGHKVEKVAISALKVGPCLACNKCARDGRCVQKDDVALLQERMLAADWLVLAAPVFFYGIPAQLKALIDRSQALWHRKYTLRLPVRPQTGRGRAAFLSVGATKGQRLFEGSVMTIKYFLDVLDADYCVDLLARDIEERGDVQRQPELLAQAEGLLPE